MSINTIFLLAILRSFSQNEFFAYPLQWGLVPIFQVSHFEKQKQKTNVIIQCNIIISRRKINIAVMFGTLIHSIREVLAWPQGRCITFAIQQPLNSVTAPITTNVALFLGHSKFKSSAKIIINNKRTCLPKMTASV